MPVTFTVPPLRLNVPKFAWEKLPARFTVELVAVIVPRLLKLPPSVSVDPLAVTVAPV